MICRRIFGWLRNSTCSAHGIEMSTRSPNSAREIEKPARRDVVDAQQVDPELLHEREIAPRLLRIADEIALRIRRERPVGHALEEQLLGRPRRKTSREPGSAPGRVERTALRRLVREFPASKGAILEPVPRRAQAGSGGATSSPRRGFNSSSPSPRFALTGRISSFRYLPLEVLQFFFRASGRSILFATTIHGRSLSFGS